MKIALLEKVGRLSLTEAEKPECNSGEALIKVMACAICRTDVKIIESGHRDLVLPRIPGHEISGVIVGTGKRVQIAPGISCGLCPYCIKGIQNMCNNMSIIGFHYDGGFAEYVLLLQEAINSGCINKMPDNLTYEEAALAEPIACCINALEMADFRSGESICIFGAGFMGSLFIQLAKAYGASRIIVIESDRVRIEASKRFGADFYVQKIKKLTAKEKIDVVIIACSSEEAPVQGIKLLSKRGRIVFFSGLNNEKRNILIDHNLIHYKELRITGAYGCTSQQNRMALKLLSAGQIKVNNLITHRVNFNEIKKGIAITKSHAGTKVVIQY